MLKISLCVFVALFWRTWCFAQSDPAFIKHLSANDLKEDHFSYISSVNVSPDSAAYLRCKYYLQYAQDSLFFDAFQQSRELSSKDTLLMNYAGIYYLKLSNRYTDKWIALTDSSKPGTSLAGFIKAVKDPGTKLIDADSPLLQSDFYNYKKALRKKPWLAAGMSAVVPGLGKAYIGRKKSFGMTLFAHVLYGVQSYESIRRLGIKGPVSIFNLGMLGVMYSANVYGSFRETRKIKREKYHQLLSHASDYYTMELGTALYR